jgi:hypothetical protein
MAAVNPPAWLQAGSYPARTDRLSAITAHLYYAGFASDEATPLRPRAGVRPSYQNYQLKVRAAATPNMTVIVSAGVAWVDNHDINGYGTYVMVNDADTTLTIAPAGGAGQYRRDVVGFTIYDAETAGSANECRLEVIQGPYAASAGATVRGTIPPNMVVLAEIAIAPSQTSVASGNITDFRNYTVSLGGIAPIPSTIAPDHPHPGQAWYQPDTDEVIIGTSTGAKRPITPDPPMMLVTGSPTLASHATSYFAMPFSTKVSSSGGTSWSSSSNPSRITVPKAGTYAVSGRAIWPGALGTADARGEVHVNGAQALTRFSTERASGGSMSSVCAGMEVLNAGDYVEIFFNQNSGSTLTVPVQFGLYRVSSAVS